MFAADVCHFIKSVGMKAAATKTHRAVLQTSCDSCCPKKMDSVSSLLEGGLSTAGRHKSRWYLVFTTGCDKLWMLGKTEDKELSRHEVWYN